LVEVAERAGCRAVMIEDSSEIQLHWLRHASTVGVTAGASAPPILVEGVIDALRSLGRVEIQEETVRTESVNFPLPLEVR
jgi:4-hydroxy-3-methylbut-2-enyl diphosphate reductase